MDLAGNWPELWFSNQPLTTIIVLKIFVKVKPWSKHEGVKKLLQGYEVAVKEPAQEGRANKRAIELLAKHFKVSKSQVVIRTGQSGRYKIVEITQTTNEL